uniref:Uncharacterized protein n=1 Tax=Arundo donax TaxID=35708 RepID=A0A0A8ZRV9_ARUDO
MSRKCWGLLIGGISPWGFFGSVVLGKCMPSKVLVGI